MTRNPDQIPEIALDWHRDGRGAVLASVVQTWGSAPRQAGSQLAISGSGQIMGSVSGGCVEGAVVAEALAALADGLPRLVTYGVSDDSAFSVGLACGGTIRILVEPVADTAPALSPDILAQIIAARATRRAVGVVTDLTTFERHLVTPTAPEFQPAFRDDKSTMLESGQFLTLHNPPLRLIVVGAVHIAQALLPMARLAGYDPILIDPRDAFGAAARFPNETILNDWPDDALHALSPDARTAVVTLTHDSKLDDPAIRAALASEVFYLGCLGSKRTHAARLERLRAAGVADIDLARIHAPVGLNIGAKTPAEIAIATLAQITATLRGV